MAEAGEKEEQRENFHDRSEEEIASLHTACQGLLCHKCIRGIHMKLFDGAEIRNEIKVILIAHFGGD